MSSTGVSKYCQYYQSKSPRTALLQQDINKVTIFISESCFIHSCNPGEEQAILQLQEVYIQDRFSLHFQVLRKVGFTILIKLQSKTTQEAYG